VIVSQTSDTDTAAAEAFREAGLDRAHDALRAQARAEAEVLKNIVEVVENAVAHPEIEVPVGMTGAKAVDHAERSAVLGLSLELAMSQDQIKSRLAEARTLTRLLPQTWAAFRAGELTGPKVRAILEAFQRVPVEEELQLYFDGFLAEKGVHLTTAKLRKLAAALAEQLADRPLEQQHELAFRRRRLWVEHEQGTGMAFLTAYLPGDQAIMAKSRIDAMAAELDDSGLPEAEQRTLEQKRLDVAADVLIGKGLESAVRPTVNVYVPLLNLAHCPDELKPATIDGQVPISPRRARELVGNCTSLTRLFTDAVDGAILGVGRKQYAPTADMRRFILARDPVCAAPGCNRAAKDCDLDHRLDWALGGETDVGNLNPKCPGDHVMKHETRWSVTPGPRGKDVWTSPGGRKYWDRTGDPPDRWEPAPFDAPPRSFCSEQNGGDSARSAA
jgi:hypothetical protein